MEPDPSDSCSCDKLIAALRALSVDDDTIARNFPDGHLLSADPKVLFPELSDSQRLALQACVDQGAKFRIDTNPNVAKALMYSALRRVDNLSADWADEVFTRYCAHLDARNHVQNPLPPLDLKGLKDKISDLKIVVTNADKNPQKLVFQCHIPYHGLIRKLVLTNEAYERIPKEQAEEIMRRLHDQLDKFGFQKTANWGVVQFLAKLHKLDGHRPKQRMLMSKTKATQLPSFKDRISDLKGKEASGHVLSKLNDYLAKFGNSVLDLLILEDMSRTVKRHWVIRTDKEVTDCLATVPESVKRLRTMDATTMYTQLPQEDLKKTLMESIKSELVPILQRRLPSAAGKSVEEVLAHVVFFFFSMLCLKVPTPC